MDMKNLLNDSGPAAPTQPKPGPPRPPSMPSTPIQTVPPQSFRDYSQTTQASPIRHVSQDYPSQPMPGAYGSPPPYQAGGPYPGRVPPPPLQSLPSADLRSPSMSSGPAPSPYRPNPTSSISSASAGFPFPPGQQQPPSPVPHHPYPQGSRYSSRDSYSQPSPAPNAHAYMQGAPPPQTPPIGTPGGAHPYLHHRSQSTHSTPTPTSAQSQPQGPQYGGPFVGSPVATTHPPPLLDHHARQTSQPPTPLGLPLTGARPGSLGSYPQPTSPYLQRLSSVGSYHHPSAQHSPPRPLPASVSARLPSNHNIYEHPPSEVSHRSQSQSEREKSLSVSPKTRVPSLPNSVAHPSGSVSESDFRPMTQPSAAPSATEVAQEREMKQEQEFRQQRQIKQEWEIKQEHAVTPAKRKLDDRDLHPDELEKKDLRPAPFEATNGHNHPSNIVPQQPPPTARKSSVSVSPIMAKQKFVRHESVPIWALNYDGRPLNHWGFILHKPKPAHRAPLNGEHDAQGSQSSRHASPDERRSEMAIQHPQHAPTPQRPPEVPNADKPLGPWEPSLAGNAPYEEMARSVADFLFMNVVGNPNSEQIRSLGIQFEIEAKLGIIIDRNTNDRIQLPVRTECVLLDDGRVTFRSSMTELQHKNFNELLNGLTQNAHEKNPANAAKPRVPIKYMHLRERDRFIELSYEMQRDQLPACMQTYLNHKHSCKVRVTYDQKTNQVVAKIVKARVADLHLFFPGQLLDCRISVNLEMNWDGPLEDLERAAASSARDPTPDRKKDRLSYRQSHYRIDLTQVIQGAKGPRREGEEKEHELEIEVDSNVLIDQGMRARNDLPNQYGELVEGFVNNVRLLTRRATNW